MDRLALAPYLDPNHLQLIILPTEQCNFRCTYCYEDFEIGAMKENTIVAIERLVEKRLPKLRSLSLSWFGGEPLMAKNTVTRLNAFAQSRCAAAGIRFSSQITTNAFGLDLATFDRLLKLDVRDYQISIDGDEEEHNKTRKLANGKASFQKIWDNLLALRSSTEPFTILLRVHVHQANTDSVRQLLPKMQVAFGADARFVIKLQAVGNWGGDSVKTMGLIKKSDQVIGELRAQLEQLGWFANRPPVPAGPGAPVPRPCYAAQPNSFVIRADGALAKCTVAFSDPRNRVGSINDDGTLELEADKLRTFMRGFTTLDEKVLHCPMHGMPKAAEVKVMTFERKSDIGLGAVPA